MKTLIRLALLMVLLPTTLARADGRVVREFTDADFGPSIPSRINEDNSGAKTVDGTRNYKGGGMDQDIAVIEVVEPPTAGPRTINVLSLDDPGIAQSRYFLLGDVKYENVEGRAYLEMWSDFPDGGHYFSRTLGSSGPMMALSGTSAKRPFMLPFTAEAGRTPNKLTLNVVMPGKGRVTLSRMRLVENAGASTAPTVEQRLLERRKAVVQSGGNAASTTAPAATQSAGLSRWSNGPGQPPVTSALSVPTAEELDAEFAKEPPEKLQDLVNSRDQFALMLPGLKQQMGADHPMYQRTAAIVAAMDRRVIALGGPALTGSLASQPASQPTAQRSEVALADLPPGVAAAVRQSMEGQLVELLKQRDDQQMRVDDLSRTDGPNGRRLIEARERLALLDQRVASLRGALAQPLPASAENATAATRVDSAATLPYIGPALQWLDRHFAAVFLSLVGVCLLAAVLLRQLARSGRGRGLVVGFFGLMIAVGTIELFAAGVAMGLGRPASAWATLLGCACIAIVVPASVLPQVRKQYADLELRKMRAMDVA